MKIILKCNKQERNNKNYVRYGAEDDQKFYDNALTRRGYKSQMKSYDQYEDI